MDRQLLLDARKTLIEEIRKELLGPGSEFSIPDEQHEIITDLPEVRYSVGILFPQGNMYESENDDTFRTKEGAGDTVLEEGDIFIDTSKIDEDNYSFGYDNNISEDANTIAEDTDVCTLDEEISLSVQNMPSSMGFTFFIKGRTDRILFEVEFGTYRKAMLEDCAIPFKPINSDYIIPVQFQDYVYYNEHEGLLKLKKPLYKTDVFHIFQTNNLKDDYLLDALLKICNQFGSRGYVREPHCIDVIVDFSRNNYVDVYNLDGKKVKLTALRREIGNDVFSITVMLVNTERGSYNGTNSIFQPKITVSTIKNPDIKFVRYDNMSNDFEDDEEDKSLALLYRNKRVYATGHGTSVIWDVDEAGMGKIYNDFLPLHEVPQMDFLLKDESFNKKCLSMKFLSDLDNTDKDTKMDMVASLIEAYSAWVSKLENKAKDLEPKFQETARRHINACKETLNRMKDGLDLLRDNSIIYNAFALANRAMFMQRIHSEIQAKDKYPEDETLQKEMASLDYYNIKDKYSWRPFQLAFIIMSIKSIVKPESNERDLVDLIWFPTGGGKTEAYLGLIAFTIFYRRLSFPETAGGTAVIMRYTLRLLAAQQFVRASTLICACESIRKDCETTKRYPAYPLGKEPITIGLWIGGEHTPNNNKIAKENWQELYNATAIDLRYVKDRYNKFQILKCPWCGTKLVKDVDKNNKLIGQWGYLFRNGQNFYMACPQVGCEFEESLPIQVVDEELYNNPPTLLFGTVDKFAMLPWKKEAGSFFAVNSKNRAPELIIQDELHLISGPLGTIVGLYEVAIDAFCSRKGVKPKIVASTATIRRAKEQCAALYNREVRQFPPPGLDAEDSFFAREADLNEKPGRLYMGIMPSGKTKAMMEARVIAAILQRVHMMDLPDDVKDKFWTLVVYFNSLKELGKCSTIINDDVKDFIRRIAFRFGTKKEIRQIGAASELTSRVSTSQLNETLEKLERLEYSKENLENKRYPINVLLATNMISVGVDVARLNVMLLVGQPKLTSEYIQATSRIGRTYPGIAFTLYDATKSRDRSHYEQFKAYHESFYKYVEPTSVTPFAKPARDRALHAVMVSMIRHMYGLSADSDAVYFDTNLDGVREIENYILERIKKINSRLDFEYADEIDVIRNEMVQFWTEWKERIVLAGHKNFYYGDSFMVTPPAGDAKRLLKVFGSGGSDTSRETLTSMRNVDKSIASNFLVWSDEG